jgi:ABC-type molybdate transport system substrate-binding protein
MRTTLKLFLAISVLSFLAFSCGKRSKAAIEPLLCYVGGTMRPAMDSLIKLYQAKTGGKIDVDQGESGTLIVQIKETRKGDLFICHDPFVLELRKEGLEDKSWTVASIRPVIVVAKGNPKKVTGLKSLGEKGMRVILTHPVYSTLGHLVPKMAERAGITDALKANVVSETRSGGEAANAVGLGTADAALVWNAVAFLRMDKLDTVSVETGYQPKSGVDAVTSATFGTIDMGNIRVTLSTLKCSKRAADAAAFAEFIASPESRAVWKSFGFWIAE